MFAQAFGRMGGLLRGRNQTTVTATWLALPVLAGGVVVSVHCAGQRSGALLWGLAALSVGAIIGFLFGIPRIVQSGSVDGASTDASRQVYRVQVNTNLEQISDWLTKIIVGLGLMNLGKLSEKVRSASKYVGATFGQAPANEHFACALILYFSVMGFALGYLLTRLYLTGAFVAADRAATSPEQFKAELEREARAVDSTSKDLPSESQVAAAERLGRLALGVDEPVVRKQAEELAREYERTRSSMRAGGERTERLDELVLRMRTLGMAARFLLPELVASASPGMRLIAVALLEVTPDPKYLPWLADRFDAGSERPFVLYHAAIALCAAASQLEPDDVAPFLSTVQQRVAKLKPDGPRDQMLLKAAQALERRKPGAIAAGTSPH